jgi:hypothetical protein
MQLQGYARRRPSRGWGWQSNDKIIPCVQLVRGNGRRVIGLQQSKSLPFLKLHRSQRLLDHVHGDRLAEHEEIDQSLQWRAAAVAREVQQVSGLDWLARGLEAQSLGDVGFCIARPSEHLTCLRDALGVGYRQRGEVVGTGQWRNPRYFHGAAPYRK